MSLGRTARHIWLLSYEYWHRHFLADRGVAARIVRLNKHPFTIVGVGPPDFHGTLLFVFPDFFLPIVDEMQRRRTYLEVKAPQGRCPPGDAVQRRP